MRGQVLLCNNFGAANLQRDSELVSLRGDGRRSVSICHLHPVESCIDMSTGGCCPVGSICGRAGKCNPASGVPGECPPSHFLCPASVGYGCCRSGMGCGTNQCFYTTPSTYTYTKTITSEDVAVTTTITTTSTPVTPGETAEAASATVLKVYPSAIEKTTPIVSGDKDGGGLTKAQLGGIVGGTVVLLVAIVVATILVVRHLKRVVKAVEGTGGTGSKGSKSRPNMQQAIKPTAGSDTDAGSGIPFLHSRNSSRQTAGSGTNSPTPYGNGSGGGNGWSSPAVNNGYHSVPTSGGERGNQNSMDSARTGYFDAAASQRSAPRRPSEQLAAGRRTSSDSQGTNATPPRQRSNTNETTSTGDVPGSSSALQELDAYPFLAELPAHPADPSRLRSGSGSSGLPPRPPSTHQRNRSGGSTHTRSDSAAGMGTPQLDVVAEMAEVHGYYGPATHVGQTAADYPMPRSP